MDLSADIREQAMVFMKSVAQRSGDPFYTVSPADGFRFAYVNDAACRHFGRSREELLALRITDVDTRLAPPGCSELWAELKDKGTVFFESVHRHRDGREIPVAVSANLFAQNGRELFGGCIHDLREERLSEEALRESEEMLRVIFNSTYDGILIHAPDGAIIDANEPFLRMHGMSREQALRLRVGDLSATPMDDAPALWERTLAGEPQLFEWKGRRYRDGSEFDVEVFLRKVRLHGRDAILANLRDITERKQVEEALIEAREAAEAGSRAKDRFLVNISHELRTPLTVIMGMLEMTLSGEIAPAQRQYLEAAQKSSQVLLTLVSDILDITRLEKGESLLEEKPFDLRRCIREAITPFFARAEEKGIRLNLHLAAGVPRRVTGDAARLQQILDNLVENGIRFTDRGEVEISVSASSEEAGRREVLFIVRDTGIGISAEALGRLFRKFTQVDDSLTRRYGGSGLGLAISRGLVERMGGRIGVESTVGEGSRFFFAIPFQAADSPQPEGSGAGAPPSAPSGRQSVLIGEDDPMIGDLVRLMLEREGYEVDLATDGRQVVEKWSAGNYDLIIMDLQMPEMDGLEATRRIREEEAGRPTRTPIVALTAHARQADEEACRNIGMDGFLTKPFDLKQLLGLLQSVKSGKGVMSNE